MGHSDHQSEGVLGHGLRDLGRRGVGNDDFSLGRGRQINIIKPHRVVGDDLQILPGRVHHLSVNLVREERKKRIYSFDRAEQFFPRDDLVLGIDRDGVARLFQNFDSLVRNLSGDENFGHTMSSRGARATKRSRRDCFATLAKTLDYFYFYLRQRFH